MSKVNKNLTNFINFATIFGIYIAKENKYKCSFVMKRVIFFSLGFSTLQPIIKYLIYHIDEFIETFDAFYFLLGLFDNIPQAMMLAYYNRLFDVMHKYLDSKFIENSKMECYKRNEKYAAIITKTFAIFLAGTGLMAIPTLFQTMYRVLIQKKNLEDNYLIPIVCILPFRVNTWTRYAFGFLWTLIDYAVVVVTKISASGVILSLCFYTIAVHQHLQAITNDFNHINLNDPNAALNILKKFIEFNVDAIRLVENLKRYANAYIFLEFVATVMILGLALVVILLYENQLEIAQLIFFFIVASTSTLSLLITNIICGQISIEGLEVADAIYMIDWHKLPINIQKIVPLLLAANRKSRYLSGYKIFIASRDSFKESMRTVASMFLSFKAIMGN